MNKQDLPYYLMLVQQPPQKQLLSPIKQPSKSGNKHNNGMKADKEIVFSNS